MPTVLRIGPYRFHFYSNEGNEPPHIHIRFEGNECKYWLEPIALAKNRGIENQTHLIAKYNERPI